MSRYLLQRLGMGAVTLWGATLVIFVLVRVVPGDVITLLLGVANYDEKTRLAIARSLGLDRPLWEQYLGWLRGVLQGDLGRSIVNGLPVWDQVARAFPSTLELVCMSLVLAVILGVPLGILASIRHGKAADFIARTGSLFFLSIPAFFIGILLMLVLSHIPGFPLLHYARPSEDLALHLLAILPATLALGLPLSGVVMRYTRTALLEILSEDFVRTARAKALPEVQVLYKHALRNAAIPLLSLLGTQAIQLVGNVVILEQVFSLPGLGQLAVNAIYQKDYTTLQGVLLVLLTFAISVGIFLDLAYALFDPRISYR